MGWFGVHHRVRRYTGVSFCIPQRQIVFIRLVTRTALEYQVAQHHSSPHPLLVLVVVGWFLAGGGTGVDRMAHKQKGKVFPPSGSVVA
jgi:hypothetical protein